MVVAPVSGVGVVPVVVEQQFRGDCPRCWRLPPGGPARGNRSALSVMPLKGAGRGWVMTVASPSPSMPTSGSRPTPAYDLFGSEVPVVRLVGGAGADDARGLGILLDLPDDDRVATLVHLHADVGPGVLVGPGQEPAGPGHRCEVLASTAERRLYPLLAADGVRGAPRTTNARDAAGVGDRHRGTSPATSSGERHCGSLQRVVAPGGDRGFLPEAGVGLRVRHCADTRAAARSADRAMHRRSPMARVSIVPVEPSASHTNRALPQVGEAATQRPAQFMCRAATRRPKRSRGWRAPRASRSGGGPGPRTA